MNNIALNRRKFLRSTAIGSLVLPKLVGSVFGATTKSKLPDLPPIRAITRGPKFHWFSYYDKLQFDQTGRYVLGMEVDFEHRSPKSDDVIKTGMVDLKNGDRWTELGQTSAWCCDTHLRFSPDGRSVVIDSPHAGNGRQMYLIDISAVDG